ncbi:MAG: HAD-IA family hydrolase, partial [Bacilli bacterium]|nr:HAD-IA family hydrolase [Bacilli bacterium]
SKDYPDIYLEAARRMGVKPEETIVFEDMPTGLKSSFEAGFISYSVKDKAALKMEDQKKKYAKGFVDDWPSFIKAI